MSHKFRVKVKSCDRPGRVDALREGPLAGDCARARSVKRGEGAVASAHEAVSHKACVCVVSREHSRRVDVVGEGVRAEASAGGGGGKGGEAAVAMTQEA